jgi:hypothetical protein
MRTALAALLIAPLISGCATLMSGTTQPINVQTTPPNSTCTIQSKGAAPIRTTAPSVVVLQRGTDYALTCEKDGYAPTTATIKSVTNGWVVGNIVNGLFPGMIVDAVTGAGWNLQPEALMITLLRPGEAPADTAEVPKKQDPWER